MNLLKNIWVRGIIIICILIGGFFFLQSYNQVEKPTLVNTQGRAFEKATVVEVLKDNIQEDWLSCGRPSCIITDGNWTTKRADFGGK